MKKIISICVSLALILTLWVPFSNAESTETDIETKSFELIEGLGIDNGINENNSELITRAEFVAMAIRCMNEDGFDLYDGSFSDVAQGDIFAKEIYKAKSLRMTNGVSEGVFAPNEPVTMQVALKIIMTAMGYESVAQAMGGFPAGYIKLEGTLHLLKGTKIDGELTVFDAKTIITNALKADVAVFNGVQNDMLIYDYVEGKNLLTENFNLSKISGVVTTADYYTLEENISDDNRVIIAGRAFTSRVESAKFFGMSVDAWFDSDNNEIYAIEKGKKNNEVVINARDVLGYSNYRLDIKNESGKSSYTMEKNLSFIENGRLIEHTDADFIFQDGLLRLIDNDGDSKYEFVMAEKKSYYVVSGINTVKKTIYDKNSSVGEICFDNEADVNKGKRRILLDNSGEEYAFSRLSVDNVVQVMMSDDKKVCIVRAGGSKTVNGILSAITEDGIEIDGTEYKTNGYYASKNLSLMLGSEYAFVIAPDGTVTTATSVGKSPIMYGYLIDYARETTGLGKTEVKILTTANSKEIYSLAKKITLNGEENVKNTDLKIDTALQNGTYPKYQLLRYKLNSDGEISLIDTSDGSVDSTWNVRNRNTGEDSLTQYLSKQSVSYRQNGNFGAPYFSFAGGVIFAVPKALMSNADADYDEELFRVITSGELVNNFSYSSDVFDINDYYYPQAIVVYTEETGASPNIFEENSTHLVYDVKNAVDEDGNNTMLIRTYSRGRYNRYYIESDAMKTVTIPNEGDLIRFALDREGKIKGINIDAQYDKQNGDIDVTYTVGGIRSILAYASGRVKTIGNGIIVLDNPDVIPERPSTNIAPIPLGSPSYVVYHSETGEVERGVITDVIGENVAGIANASKVVCRLNYYLVTDVFIYTE